MVRILTSDNPVHGFRTPEPPLKFVPFFFVSVSYIEIFICVYEIIII